MIEVKEKGVFTFHVYDKEGHLRETRTANNTLTTEGALRILNLTFSTAANDTIYTGLISNSGSPVVTETNTAAQMRLDGASSIPNGWVEVDNPGILIRASYDSQTFGTKSVSWNETEYTMATDPEVIAGAFVINVATLSTTTTGNIISGDTLYACALFAGGDLTIEVGETIKVTFDMTLNS